MPKGLAQLYRRRASSIRASHVHPFALFVRSILEPADISVRLST